MHKAKLIIKDEVNVKFEGLSPNVRRICNDKLKFFIHAARHMPAFKLGRWDGTVSYFALNGNTYLNLLEDILPIIVENGYEIEIEDLRKEHNLTFTEIDENFLVENAPNSVWPAKHPAAGEPILLRDYQVDIVNTFLENPQSLGEIATGAGKTIITATLSLLCEQYGRTIVIVPNKSLVDQTEEDYRNLGLDVGVYYGDRKELGKTHTICTWQSLNVLKKAKQGIGLEKFIDNVICVIVDEAHQSKGQVLRELLCGPFANVPIRWGLTGTVPKEEHDAMNIKASIGPVVNELSAKTLMDQGVLAQCHVNIQQLLDIVEFKNFHEESSFLVTDAVRLEWITKFIEDTSKTGNTLVLINRIETGKILHENLKDSKFIHGVIKSTERKETYHEVADNDNMVIIATYGVAAVGINIPRIFNLILIEPGKSFVRVIQSIGRGIRKAKDKDFVQIWDITSTCKFSSRHLAKRKTFYKNANYPYTIDKINYLGITKGK